MPEAGLEPAACFGGFVSPCFPPDSYINPGRFHTVDPHDAERRINPVANVRTHAMDPWRTRRTLLGPAGDVPLVSERCSIAGRSSDDATAAID